jgi:hypothetical protein
VEITVAAANVRVEREKRKTQLQERILDLLSKPEVFQPLMLIGGSTILQQLGEKRIINRDWAGFLLAMWVCINLIEAGLTDKWALGAATTAATAGYAVSTPSKDSDPGSLVINPGKLLGGDGKLFWWDLSGVPGIGPWLAQQ